MKPYLEDLSMYFRSENADGVGEKPFALMMMTVMMVTILMTKNNARYLHSATHLTQIFGNSMRQGDISGL